MALNIRRTWIPTAQEWDDAWQRCPYATYFHGREWAEIWAEGASGRYSPDPMAVELDDGTRIVLPFSIERFLRGLGRRHVSSPAGTFGGWLADASLAPAQQAALLDWVSARYPDLVWRINPYEQLLARPGTGRVTPDETHVLDLRSGFDAVYRNWRKGCSSAAQQASHAGVRIRLAGDLDDWERYYLVYEDSLRRWGPRASSRYPWTLFRTMADRASPDIRLWLAESGGTVIAGALCFSSPLHVVYWHGAALSSHFKLRPVNLLIREVIRDSAARGLTWFDFNPSGGHQGVKDFKRGFGAVTLPSDVIEFASTRTRLVSAAARLWQKASR